ncbi:uncharacterized protein METZ01_LOCUS130751 [marine metagenome]|uniref:Uncharacterized protein n=1 Tax=marine metagenome TaxID=408172 RepID=A0A381YN01_9ZZZZ
MIRTAHDRNHGDRSPGSARRRG